MDQRRAAPAAWRPEIPVVMPDLTAPVLVTQQNAKQSHSSSSERSEHSRRVLIKAPSKPEFPNDHSSFAPSRSGNQLRGTSSIHNHQPQGGHVNDLILYAFRGVGALLYAFPMFLAAWKSGDAEALATSTRMARLADRRLCANGGFACAKELGDAIGVET
jgi:hypothetical protein